MNVVTNLSDESKISSDLIQMSNDKTKTLTDSLITDYSYSFQWLNSFVSNGDCYVYKQGNVVNIGINWRKTISSEQTINIIQLPNDISPRTSIRTVGGCVQGTSSLLNSVNVDTNGIIWLRVPKSLVGYFNIIYII